MKRAAWLASLAVLCGLVLFYFVDNPFTLAFKASIALTLGGAALAMVLFGINLAGSPRRVKRLTGIVLLATVFLAVSVVVFGLVAFRVYFHHAMSKGDWKEDLQFLAKSVAETDPSPLARALFQGKAQKLIDELPSLTEEQIKTGLVELVASLHDGHSNVLPVQPATGFRMFPLQLYIFSDGTYVTAAAPEYSTLVGLRLTKIGNTAIEDVYKITKPLVGADNEWTVKDRIPLFFLCPEVLHSTGIIQNEEEVAFSFAGDTGVTVTKNLRPVSIYADFYWYFKPFERWKYRSQPSTSLPLYLREPWNNYWFTYDSNTRVLIFECREIKDKHDEGLVQFGHRLLGFAGSHRVDRFIIDLRQNGGGDNTLVRQFVEDLSRNATVNRRGTLFALIGRHTFSAGTNFTSLLENKTETIFVGEPTGSGPNHYGDAKQFALPHSKIFVSVSSLRHEFGDPIDSRSDVAPDVPVSLSHRDYFSRRDPALETALSYQAAPIAVTPVSSALIERYVGRYFYDFDRVVQISNSPAGVKLDIEHFFSAELYPVSETRFRTARGVLEVAFELNTDPKLDEIRWSVDGQSRLLERLAADLKTPHELLAEGKLSECAEAYRRYKQANPFAAPVSERTLNGRGYEFLEGRQYEQAIFLFTLAVEFYPDSANAYDSLGEAYMLSGNNVSAIENYRKSLGLNPANANAKQMLRKLGAS